MQQNYNQSHILIVDDDDRIRKLLKKFLEKNNFLVSTAHSVEDAKRYLHYFIFDLMILDVMLPGVTGLDFAEHIKTREDTNIPIIMLTALGEVKDRIKGLQTGADDYLTKPFDPTELLLRAQNLIELYGYNSKKSALINFNDCSYDIYEKELLKGDYVIKLTQAEQSLLDLFIENRKQILSRSDIATKLGDVNERTVDVQVVRLRNKIEQDPKNPKFLLTVRNGGYVLSV